MSKLTRKLTIFKEQAKITIPKHLVLMQNWNNGDEIEFRVDRDEIIMRKSRT